MSPGSWRCPPPFGPRPHCMSRAPSSLSSSPATLCGGGPRRLLFDDCPSDPDLSRRCVPAGAKPLPVRIGGGQAERCLVCLGGVVHVAGSGDGSHLCARHRSGQCEPSSDATDLDGSLCGNGVLRNDQRRRNDRDGQLVLSRSSPRCRLGYLLRFSQRRPRRPRPGRSISWIARASARGARVDEHPARQMITGGTRRVVHCVFEVRVPVGSFRPRRHTRAGNAPGSTASATGIGSDLHYLCMPRHDRQRWSRADDRATPSELSAATGPMPCADGVQLGSVC